MMLTHDRQKDQVATISQTPFPMEVVDLVPQTEASSSVQVVRPRPKPTTQLLALPPSYRAPLYSYLDPDHLITSLPYADQSQFNQYLTSSRVPASKVQYLIRAEMATMNFDEQKYLHDVGKVEPIVWADGSDDESEAENEGPWAWDQEDPDLLEIKQGEGFVTKVINQHLSEHEAKLKAQEEQEAAIAKAAKIQALIEETLRQRALLPPQKKYPPLRGPKGHKHSKSQHSNKKTQRDANSKGINNLNQTRKDKNKFHFDRLKQLGCRMAFAAPDTSQPKLSDKQQHQSVVGSQSKATKEVENPKGSQQFDVSGSLPVRGPMREIPLSEDSTLKQAYLGYTLLSAELVHHVGPSTFKPLLESLSALKQRLEKEYQGITGEIEEINKQRKFEQLQAKERERNVQERVRVMVRKRVKVQ